VWVGWGAAGIEVGGSLAGSDSRAAGTQAALTSVGLPQAGPGCGSGSAICPPPVRTSSGGQGEVGLLRARWVEEVRWVWLQGWVEAGPTCTDTPRLIPFSPLSTSWLMISWPCTSAAAGCGREEGEERASADMRAKTRHTHTCMPRVCIHTHSLAPREPYLRAALASGAVVGAAGAGAIISSHACMHAHGPGLGHVASLMHRYTDAHVPRSPCETCAGRWVCSRVSVEQQVDMHTRIHSHMHMHTRTHMHMHTHTHIHTNAHTHFWMSLAARMAIASPSAWPVPGVLRVLLPPVRRRPVGGGVGVSCREGGPPEAVGGGRPVATRAPLPGREAGIPEGWPG